MEGETIISIKTNDIKVTWEGPGGLDAEEVIEAFAGLMATHTWSMDSILQGMNWFIEDYGTNNK